jgi:type IV secretion system protein VirB5
MQFPRRQPAPTPSTGSDTAVDPFLAARQNFLGVLGDQARAKRNWQLTALLAVGGWLFTSGAYFKLASESRITPYIVEVDRLGQSVAFGPAEKLAKTDHRLIVSQLGLVIRNLRSVYPDPGAQREMIERGYAFVAPSAASFLNGYFSDPQNDPRLLAQQLTRQILVQSVLPVPNSDTWRVQWTESETPLGVGPPRTTAWEGYLTVRVVPPTKASEIQDNPLGLYVTAINWTPVTQGKGANQ